MEKYIIHRDDTGVKMYAFPDIAKLRDSRLMCVFLETTTHTNRDLSRICIKESTDCGRTWKNLRYLTGPGTPEVHYNCPRITCLRDGRIVILCDLITGKTDGNHNMIRLADTYVHMWIGDCDGERFSGPEILPFRGMVSDRLLELESGRWYIGSHRDYGTQERNLEVFGHYSDDQGETWSEAIPMGIDARYQLCETSVVEYAPGKLVALFRENSDSGIEALKALSYDNGGSWEGVYVTNIPCAHKPVIGKLQDGRFLITYRLRPGGRGTGNQITLGVLTNQASLEAKERRDHSCRFFPIDYDRSNRPDNGYTGWVQLDDETVYVINYLVDDTRKAQIRGTVFHPSELILDVAEPKK